MRSAWSARTGPGARLPAAAWVSSVPEETEGVQPSGVPGQAARHGGPDRSARLRLLPQARAAGTARHFTRTTCTQWDLPAPLDAALLVVSELVTNAVRHAGSPVTLHLFARPDHLRVEVEDEAPAPPQMRQAASMDLGGRGLALVEAVSREWGSSPSPTGKVVWATLALTGS